MLQENRKKSIKDIFFQELTIKELESINGGTLESTCVTHSPGGSISIDNSVTAGNICTYQRLLAYIYAT